MIVKARNTKAWELDVLGVPYGGPENGRDSDGQNFSQRTRLHEDKFPLPPVVYYHGMDEDGRSLGSPEYIGKTVGYEDRPDGRWYHVILDETKDIARRVWDAAKNGIARASSGTAGHLARFADNGHIDEWPVVELSLFDAIGARQPTNQYAVALPRLKALGIEPQTKGGTAKGAEASPEATGAALNEVKQKEVKQMSEQNDTKQEAAEIDYDQLAKAVKAAETKATEASELESLRARLAKLEEEDKRPVNDPGFAAKTKSQTIITNADSWKYDNYDGGEIGMAMNVIKSARGNSEPVDPALRKAFFQRLESEEALKSKGLTEARNQARRLGIKANETDFTTNVGFGDEWVGVGYSADLWEKIRQETFVIEKLAMANGNRSVGPGQESIYFPLEGTDPEWYTVAQAGDPSSATAQVTNTVPAKALGTGRVQATLAKSGTSTIYTGEMVEDSVLDFVSALRRQIVISGAEILEAIAINGDTEAGATTNINDIAGTPAATDWFMAVNGFRKLALVTNTANSRDGGVLTSGDFLETIKLMGNAGLAGLNPSMSGFIIDPYTHYKALQLLDVKSRDVFNGATIEDGRLTGIYGTPVFVSGQIHKGATNLLANAAGKVDIDTQGNNTTGAILAVRWDQWRFGYRRDMTMEVERIPRADAWEITSLMRYHLTARDTEASAETYNLTV